MKTVGAAFVAGLLGMLLGSLTAQNPPEESPPPQDDGVLHAGPIETITLGSGNTMGEPGVRAELRENWVRLTDTNQFIPREQIAVVTFARNPAAGDFGDQPGDNRPDRRGFRED